MRIERVRERVHESLEHVIALDLVHAFEITAIALLQDFARVVPGLIGQREVEDVVLDPLSPYLVEFGRRHGPRRFGSVELVLLVDSEIGFDFELLECEPESFAHARTIDREDIENGIERPIPDHVVEVEAELFEVRDIAVEQVHPVAVEFLDIAIHDLRREFVINRDVQVVRLLDELGYELADILVPRVGS